MFQVIHSYLSIRLMKQGLKNGCKRNYRGTNGIPINKP